MASESEYVSVNDNMVDFPETDIHVRDVLGDDVENTNTTGGDDDDGGNDGGTPSSSTGGKGRALCWKFFTVQSKDDFEDKKFRASCNACHKVYIIGSTTHGTSNLNRHLPRCPRRTMQSVNQMHIDTDARLRSKKFCQATFREKQALAIIKHDYPFSIVEHEGLRNLHKYLNADMKFISRNTSKADVLKVYASERTRLKKILGSTPGRICLTSDIWTSCTTEGYLCLTAHYVTDQWKLDSKILAMTHMRPPHSGMAMSVLILDLLKQWGIDENIFSITLDNASSNGNMQNHLKNALKLRQSLLCNGEFFHVRCCAHVLNLIVQKGLKVISEELSKIRESVKYLKWSEGRMSKFEECVKTAKINASISLRLDMPIRWNSTYLMLESALKYRDAFSLLESIDHNYKTAPSNEDWERGQKVCEFLEPFYHITNLFSGSTYPTSNLYFLKVWEIQILLLDSMKSGDDSMKKMATKMMEKFNEYWEEYSLVLAFGVVVDPRFKGDILDWAFKQSNPDNFASKTLVVLTKLKVLFEEYKKKLMHEEDTDQTGPSSISSQMGRKNQQEAPKKDILTGFDKSGSSNDIEMSEKTELEVYLSESRLDRLVYPELDVLEYWKKEKVRFPILSVLARDLLSIPVTTVASESSFSIGGRILNKYRSSLLSDNFEALILTRNWVEGFEAPGDDDIEDGMLEITPQKMAASDSHSVHVLDD